MKLATLVLILSPIIGFSQSFEGTITYANRYKSKSTQVTDEQLSSMMGTTQEYYIKGGDYKSAFNGGFIKMQLYKAKENKSYTLTAKSDSLYWEDYGNNKDVATSFEVEKAKETILGQLCDVITVITPKSRTSYFYTSKYGINPGLFIKHQYGNWYYMVSRAKAVPLKTVYEDAQLVLTSTAVKITATSLSDSTFSLTDERKVLPAIW